jgi:hypothetical protein
MERQFVAVKLLQVYAALILFLTLIIYGWNLSGL